MGIGVGVFVGKSNGREWMALASSSVLFLFSPLRRGFAQGQGGLVAAKIYSHSHHSV